MNLGNIVNRLLANIARMFAAIFNIKIRLKYVMIVIVLLVSGAVGLTYSTMMRNVGGKESYNDAMRYVEIKNLVNENYIDEVDMKAMGDYAAAAMVAGLGDKWSYYMSDDEYKTYQLSYANEYSGIGMSILKHASGGFQVVSVNTGSPANLAGLSAGMIITAVDGEKVTGMEEDEVRTLIRSQLNTKFTLEINGDEILEVDCSKTYVSPVNYRLEKTEAGYVQILNFEAGAGTDAVNAIEELISQGAVALVLDVRGNPGGLMSELEVLLDHLLPNVDLFTSVDKGGHREVTRSDSVCIQLPICVLVNTETYGAAELFAAVLQEYDWAQVLGEATMGNTRSQETLALADGSAVRLSTHTYLTPKGLDLTASGGVIPDMIVYNSDASATGTTAGTTGTASDGTASVSNDDQLMAALKLLS